jgi:hypothetical protein
MRTPASRDRSVTAWSMTSVLRINPLLLKGQIVGGVAQGVGQI